MTFIEELEIIGVDADSIRVIQSNFSGCAVYIPKLRKIDLTARNKEIRREFNGRNHKQLARDFGLCYQTICKIVGAKNDT